MAKSIVFTSKTHVNGIEYAKGDELSVSSSLYNKLVVEEKVAKDKVVETKVEKPKKGK